MKTEDENGKPGISREFKKTYYELCGQTNFIIVHYQGDEKQYVPMIHGNRKSGHQEFIRTNPSVLQKIKETISNAKPEEAYQKLVTESSQHGSKNVRNLRQITNIKASIERNRKLGNDEFLNLIEQCIEIEGGNYALSVLSYPDVVCVFALKELLEELNKLLTLETDPPVSLYYDTTFNIGDF